VEPSDLLDAYHSGDLTGDDVFIEDPAFVDPTFVDCRAARSAASSPSSPCSSSSA
jgi:hypothetical protein